MDDKFDVIVGTATFTLKIFNDVIEKGLDDSILGRHAYRTILESYINIKYLQKIEAEHENIWQEYKIYGKQIKGQGLGAKSFVPTINLKVHEFLLPNEGVYITKTILDNKEFNSITFLGHRVTTDGSYAVETHIIDEDIKNDNHTTQIKFYEKLRENKKFDSFEELKNQILDDIKSAKNYFINIY